MINIGKYRNLQPIEEEWRKNLSQYLFDPANVYFVIGKRNCRRKYFNSRYDKAIGIIEYAYTRRKIKANEKKNLTDVLCKYRQNIHDIAIGSKKCFDTWGIKTFSTNELNILKKIFIPFFEEFSKIFGYKLLGKLNIRTCPYCNRNYTFAIKRTAKNPFQTRPEFDHFYDKATYPLLALSFYNLVPSCPICNHGKRNNSAGVNPYFNGVRSKLTIVNGEEKKMNSNEILAINNRDDISLAFSNPTEEEKANIITFGLNKLYQEHRDYVEEMIEKANAYNTIQNENLVDAFQGVNRFPQDVFDFVWGKYLQDAELEKRPLSKLTKDILEQLNIKK